MKTEQIIKRLRKIKEQIECDRYTIEGIEKLINDIQKK